MNRGKGGYSMDTSFRIVSLNKNVVISNEPEGNCAPEVRRNLIKVDNRPCEAYKISPRNPAFTSPGSFEMTFFFNKKDVSTR
ncbi:hypothetical protein FHS10_004370 [Mucilaginibacter dorajii]|nr:hypothetical protein [Mucilaginibacter dorajii]